jgi:hypothetical protein
MAKEGARSQVSVVCWSHVWLKVEEEQNGRGRAPSQEEKKEVKIKSQAGVPCSPFYMTRGAGHMIEIVQARRKERALGQKRVGGVFAPCRGNIAVNSRVDRLHGV